MKSDPVARWAEQLVRWAPPRTDGAAKGAAEDSWAKLAQWYARISGRAKSTDSSLLARLRDISDRRSIMLDVGAGTGRLAVPLSEFVGKVIAVEASPAMTRALRQRLAAMAIDNVEIVEGRWPAVEVGAVDVAYCANVVYDVKDLAPFLWKLDQVANKRCFVELTPRHPLDAYRELWIELVGWTPPAGPTYRDAVDCLRQLGIYPEVEIVPSKSSIVFQDGAEAAAFYRDRLGLAEDSAAEATLRQRVAVLMRRVDGGCSIPEWQHDKTVILSWVPARTLKAQTPSP